MILKTENVSVLTVSYKYTPGLDIATAKSMNLDSFMKLDIKRGLASGKLGVLVPLDII